MSAKAASDTNVASIRRPLPSGTSTLSDQERQTLKQNIERSAKDEPISGVRVRSQYLRDLLTELRAGTSTIDDILEALVTSTVAKLGTRASDNIRESVKAMLLDALRDDPTLVAWADKLRDNKIG